jgi:hypothetical protein
MSVMQEVVVEIIGRKCPCSLIQENYIYLFRDIVCNNVMPCSLIEVTKLFGGYTASIFRVEVSLKMEAAYFSIMLLNFYQNA